MSKKKSITAMPMSAIFGRTIAENKETEGPIIMEVNRKMQEILAGLLPSWKGGARIWRWNRRTKASP
jgi:hypothetical protein